MKVFRFRLGFHFLVTLTPRALPSNCYTNALVRRYHLLLSDMHKPSCKKNMETSLIWKFYWLPDQENRKKKFSFSQYQNKCTKSESTDSDSTHFGYKIVSREEKADKVHDVFENVADKYDLMNDLMSWGIHRLWKDTFVAHLNPTPGIRLLDVAGGTGDITFRVLQYIHHQMKDRNQLGAESRTPAKLAAIEDVYQPGNCNGSSVLSSETSKVTVCDISQRMLAVGRKRAAAHGFYNIEWVCGNALALPFPAHTFDAYTIAYGMRNVVDVGKALREAYRVLKPGGRFLCLEFSQVKNSLIRSVYDLYSFQLIPVMGQVVAGDWDSYQYLVESIRKFPDQETYKAIIEAAGFRRVAYEELTFGVTAIHSGFKI